MPRPKGSIARRGRAPRSQPAHLRPEHLRPAGRRSLATVVLGLLVVLVGAVCVAYPYASDYLHKVEQARVIAANEQAVEETGDDALADELAAAQAYNERLLASRVVVTDPFDPSNPLVSTEEYEARLDLDGTGVMGTIVIPKLGVSVPIYHGTSDEVLQQGVGHLSATSLPVGGESSHCVLAGHNGLPSVRIFDDLDQLDVGDYFVIHVLGEDLAYRVTSTEVVEPDETEGCRVVEGEDLVTLITCTPYGVNTHRLLVRAARCEVPDEYYSDPVAVGAEAAGPVDMLWALSLAGLAIGAGLVAAVFVARRGRRRGPASDARK